MSSRLNKNLIAFFDQLSCKKFHTGICYTTVQYKNEQQAATKQTKYQGWPIPKILLNI